MTLYANIPDEDMVLVAELFQLARSGRYHKVEELKAEVKEFTPDTCTEKLDRCLRHLARILHDSNHGGYRDLYERENTRKALAQESRRQTKALRARQQAAG